MFNIFKLRGHDLKVWNYLILIILLGIALSCVAVTVIIIGGGTLYFNWPF